MIREVGFSGKLTLSEDKVSLSIDKLGLSEKRALSNQIIWVSY